MSQTVTANYTGGVLVPGSPLDLPLGATVEVTVKELPSPEDLSLEQRRVLVDQWLQLAKDFSSVPRLTRDELHDRD